MKYWILLLPFFVFAQETDSLFSLEYPDVQTLSAEYISSNPHYDIKDILALQQGVTLLDDQLNIRGGRPAFNNYFLDGAFSNDIMTGGNGIYLIPSALERVNLYVDHTPSGLSVAGGAAIMARIKKGGDHLEAHFNLQGDGFAQRGQELLNSYSYGQRILTASISGPLAGGAVHYFLAAENNYKADALQRFNSGFHFDHVPPFSAGSDPVSLDYPGGFTPHNQSNLFAVNGALDIDFWGTALRISGSASRERRQNDPQPWLNILNDRIPLLETQSTLLSAQLTRHFGSWAAMKIQAGYYNRFSETGDNYFGNDWMSWYDSSKVAKHGATFSASWRPKKYLNIYGVNFSQKGAPQNRYSKDRQNSLFGSVDFLINLGKNHLLRSGANVRSYTVRHFAISPSVMSYVDDRYNGPAYKNYTSLPIDEWISNGEVDAFGYDIYGSRISDWKDYPLGEYVLGPGKPVFGGIYLDDTYRTKILSIRAGLRLDYFDFGSHFINEPPSIHYNNNKFRLRKTHIYKKYSPYISIAGHLIKNLSFYLNYLKASAPGKMNTLFMSGHELSIKSQSGIIDPIPAIQPKAVNIQKINIGSRFSPTKFVTIDISLFHHNYRQLRGMKSQWTWQEPFFITFNNADYSSITGFETSLSFKYQSAFWGRLLYGFQRGNGFSSVDNIYYIVRRGYIPSIPETENLITHNGGLDLNYAFVQPRWGSWLAESHISLFVHFKSGHRYTRQGIKVAGNLDIFKVGVDNMTLASDKNYIEAINSSSTPWEINTDLILDKSFEVTEKLGVTFFVRVTNLFNRKNVLNVYAATGNANDDGILSNPVIADELTQKYGTGTKAFYKAVVLGDGNAYRSILGKELFGRPRQIFAGIKLAY